MTTPIPDPLEQAAREWTQETARLHYMLPHPGHGQSALADLIAGRLVALLRDHSAQAEERGHQRALDESLDVAKRSANLIETLNEREAQAFKEGQERMRERASQHFAAEWRAAAIRALPLEPKP